MSLQPIMALDLASVSGYAVGAPGEKPVHGSHRFAGVGASHEAIFAGAVRWTRWMISYHAPSLIVWEAPLPTSFKRGKTTNDVTTVLYGLSAVVGATAYLRGIYDIRKAETRNVRLHFIGCNPKRAKAKPLVKRQCRAMGWEVEDDNEADSLAVWHFMCSILEPKLATAPTRAATRA